MHLLDAAATQAALPYPDLAHAIAQMLRHAQVQVPTRLVPEVSPGAHLFVMPASDGELAITKLISLVRANAERGLPTIQGQVVVFNARDGRCLMSLDGPSVTARRTAAVSLLAAQTLSPRRDGDVLIVGAGVQGRAHLEAFAQGLGLRRFWIASRTRQSAQALADHARQLGLWAQGVDDPHEALPLCDWVLTCTPATSVSLHQAPKPGAFVSAVGAYTPRMAEWSIPVCQALAQSEAVRIVVDSRDADHEAGDFLQAGLSLANYPTLAEVLVAQQPATDQTVFFHNCGWAGWDLAAARCAVERLALKA
ncbi:MAG: hypothetical protein RL111_24 [Pseudomonadota bacterium]